MLSSLTLRLASHVRPLKVGESIIFRVTFSEVIRAKLKKSRSNFDIQCCLLFIALLYKIKNQFHIMSPV